MARTTGTVSLSDLLKNGTLQQGESLIFRRRSAPSVEGVLQPDGTISINNLPYNTPSRAARAVAGNKPIDGWRSWRVIRLGNKTLAEVREMT